MAVSVIGQIHEEPAYITYLLNPEVTHDFYFIVRNQQSGQTEKIGVVRKMLMAHSEVLRSELEDSQLAMKHDAHLADLYSNTLRNLLRYVYGYDIISVLSFDDADNLLYAAEKYMIEPLKNKLASRLISLLNPDNICSLMHNPACFRHLELNSEITKILQFKTNELFVIPEFLDITSAVFLKILEQDTMNVEEIEVWRAALKWAKHKASSEDGQVLRTQLSDHMKLIRFCTLSLEDLCKEVLPSDVLKNNEFGLICTSLGVRQEQSELKDICNNIERRNKSVHVTLFTDIHEKNFITKGSTFELITKKFGIELLSLVFKAKTQPLKGSFHTYHINTSIYIICPDSITHDLNFSQEVSSGEDFSVPTTINAQYVKLLPYSKYDIRVVFSEVVTIFKCESTIAFTNDDITVKFESFSLDYDDGDEQSYGFAGHVNCLKYRALTS